VNSSDIRAALRRHYGKEAVLVDEVANGTGANVRRRIDVVAVGCWPSRGLYLHAIEIKVSRGDLRRELRDPEKADVFYAHCDAFYIAAPKGLVKEEELPKSWGLYEVDEKGLVRCAASASVNRTDEERARVSRSFLASLVRSIVETQSGEVQLAKVRDEAYGQAVQELGFQHHREVAAHRREVAALRSQVQGLQDWRDHVSGYAYMDANAVGRSVRIMNNLTGHMGSLNALRVNAKHVLDDVDEIKEIARRVFRVHEDFADGDGI